MVGSPNIHMNQFKGVSGLNVAVRERFSGLFC